ncbi:hypothetical protein [Sorangium sp. So ce1151]
MADGIVRAAQLGDLEGVLALYRDLHPEACGFRAGDKSGFVARPGAAG